MWRGHLTVDGALSQVHVERFAMEKGVVAADVVLTGQLGVTFTP